MNILAKKLPRFGDRIPLEKFFVSEYNVNVDEPFGDSDQDQKLIANLRASKKIREPFHARPEKDGLGVYEGRRRFLGAKAAGFNSFVVGEDCLIKDVSPDEAREASWVENFKGFQIGMNPVARAKALNEIMTKSTTGLRGTAARLGIGASTLSEYLKVLELGPGMQEALSKGLLYYTDALQVARLKPGKELEAKLVTLLEEEGLDVFKKELTALQPGALRRGIPAGKYNIIRTTWDKAYKLDVQNYEKLTKLAEAAHMEVDEYSKQVLSQHAQSSA